MVDADPVLCRRGKLVPIECGVDPSDDRPRLSVGGRFVGEIARVEFREGGVDVIESEPDDGHDPTVGTDLDDVDHFRLERRGADPLRTRRSPRVAIAVDVTVVTPSSARISLVRDFGISAVPDSTRSRPDGDRA